MRTSNGRARGGLAALWVAAALAAAGAGLPAPAAAQDIRRPHLAGHTFLSTDLIPEAFVSTYVRNSLGYAQALDLEYPPVVVHGDTLVTLQGDLVYALLGFEYEQAVKDWIAVRTAVSLRTRLGTQAASLVRDGVTVGSGVEFGWMARLHQSRTTMLCGSLIASRQSYTAVDLRGFVEDVIAGAPNPRLIDDIPVVRGRGGLHFAWALSRPFGLTLFGETSYGEAPRRGAADGWEYSYGACVDFDAGAAWDIPLGAALAYRQTSLPEFNSSIPDIGRQTILRLAYNAQPDFVVGVDLLALFNRENTDREAMIATGAMVTLRYYF
jgi:hypothetical protein